MVTRELKTQRALKPIDAIVCSVLSRVCLILISSYLILDSYYRFWIPNICNLHSNWNFGFSESVECLFQPMTLFHFIRDSVYNSVLFDIHGFNECIWQRTIPNYFLILKDPLSIDVRAYIVYCTLYVHVLGEVGHLGQILIQ